MQYRRLGKTNLRVSVIGIGTWQLGGEWGKDFTVDEAAHMLGRAKDLGINLIDTAECYGDHTSEALIGAAIDGQRGDWIIATKFGHKFHGHLKRTDERSPADMRQQLDASLKALRTDYVDVLQFHSVRDAEFANEELWKALDDVKKVGKARHIGNSIGGDPQAYQTELSTKAGVEVIQVVYNRLDRGPEERILPSCQRQDLGVLARVPLASGLLSGKYKPGATFGASDHRAAASRNHLDQRIKEVEDLQRNEVPAGVDMAQWALAWCLRNPAVTAVIPGCKSLAQVESNAAAANLL